MNNQRGGIIANILIVPIGIALMAGIYFLGYYAGLSKAKAVASGEARSPLPDIISENIPKSEEFTFYKTLADKENKTVSIEVKPRAVENAVQSGPRETPLDARQEKIVKLEKKTVIKADKPAMPAPKQTLKQAPASSNGRLRYTIQLASYPEKRLAEDEVKKMKKRGYVAFPVAFETGKGTWYRVRLGSFSSRDAAEKLLKDIKSKAGGSPFITIE